MNLKTVKSFFFFLPAVAAVFFLFLSAAANASDFFVDSDGDGYGDTQEIASGYSPVNPQNIKIEKSDMDADGLSDYWELIFKTDLLNADSDNDGFPDGQEIDFAYNPLSGSKEKLSASVEINLQDQKLRYLVGGQVWKEFSVSSGKASMPTPTGTYKIINKVQKAWSKAYGLWMPYWLGLDKGQFGIHELPVWPSGYREGAAHLGVPVSHGCVRLGVGPAQYIYERLSVGATVTIK
jgi:hypothetical protein